MGAQSNIASWPDFLKWASTGFLVGFGFLTGFTIGIPFLVVGLIAFVVLLVRGPGWPSDLGLLAGAGMVCLVIAIVNLAADGESQAGWAAFGAALVVLGSGAFLLLQPRSSQR